MHQSFVHETMAGLCRHLIMIECRASICASFNPAGGRTVESLTTIENPCTFKSTSVSNQSTSHPDRWSSRKSKTLFIDPARNRSLPCLYNIAKYTTVSGWNRERSADNELIVKAVGASQVSESRRIIVRRETYPPTTNTRRSTTGTRTLSFNLVLQFIKRAYSKTFSFFISSPSITLHCSCHGVGSHK